MKRTLCLFLTVLMLVGMTGCGSTDELSFTEGTYTATADGFHGPLTIEVNVSDSEIISMEMTESVERSGIGDAAFDKISAQILEDQTLKVDIATGATVSSGAIMTAVKDALTQAGGDIEYLMSKEVEHNYEEQTIDTDVVVIGSGGAGMSAAIEAAKGGAEVVVLEKLSRTGGSTRTSSGMIVVGGSELQEEAGIEDSVEALKEYWIERGNDDIDEDMAVFAAEKANEALDFLMDAGVGYTKDLILISGTTTIPRAHIPPGYGGEFMDMLVAQAEELGVVIYTDTPAESLIQNADGKIVGVNATQNGADFTVNASAVIVATGGFDHSEELKAEYSPDAVGAWAVSAPGNTGDGIVMGTEVGADTVFKGGVIGWKVVSPLYGHTTMIGRPIYGLPNLIVNESGSRFADESEDYPFLFKNMVKDGGDMFYFIFDSEASDTETLEALTGTLESLDAAVEAGVAYKADTIEELAEMAGLDNLQASVDGFNAAVAGGADEEFGRDVATMQEIGAGPFYALQSQIGTLGTFGGLKVNIDSEVLDTAGNAIPGLYAAGEVANGDFFTDIYPASGSSISMCVIFGREAGINAAAYVK